MSGYRLYVFLKSIVYTVKDSMKKLIFSEHAESKFKILEKHGFHIEKDIIISALEDPDSVEPGYKGRMIAQKIIDETHLIRVVYECSSEVWRIITFYPGRRKRYENEL